MLLESLDKMSTIRLQAVAQFIDIEQHDQGCITPAEAFITGLVADYYRRGGLTPDDVVHKIEGEEGFRINFNDALDMVKRFVGTYPAALFSAPPAAPGPAAE